MAQASPLLTVTPKQLGKHLRDVRRKKGLSLSEVARGAGLSRRELVAYERGKVPIPESDLWVLAGSCGVDVSELMPRTSPPELAAGASSTTIGDTVAQLRRSQDDADLAPYLASLHRLKELPPGKRVPVKDRELQAIANALGREPQAMEQRLQKVMQVSPEEAARLRELILPPIRSRKAPKAIAAAAPEIPAPSAPVAPPTFLDTPLDTPIDTSVAHHVDVFEELARLPEPLPLGDPAAEIPDVLAAPPPPPEGTVELVDGLPQPVNAAGFASGSFAPPEPVLVDTAAAVWNAADAPPIDVAQRQGSDTWDWSEPPAAPLPSRTTEPDSWEPTPWQPPAPPGSGSDGPPSFWEGTDDWTPIAPESSLATPETDAWLPTDPWASPATWTPTEPAPSEPFAASDASAVTDAWTPTDWESATWGDPWTNSPAEPDVIAIDPNDPWTAKEWPQDLVADAGEVAGEIEGVEDTTIDGAVATGPWDHQPDPAAVSSGFYVDWGTPEPDAAPAPWEALVGPDPSDVGAVPFADTPVASPEVIETYEAIETYESAGTYEPVGTYEPIETYEPVGPYEPVDLYEPVDMYEPDESQPPEPIEPIEPIDEPDEPVEDDDAPPMIMWRADGLVDALSDDTEAAVEIEVDTTHQDLAFEPAPAFEAVPDPEPEPESAPTTIEFVTAGSDWQLGNALPLVEVRGQGALVMRRADERWALADVTTTPDFIAEVDLDFRSGPGLGVLFRASVDEAGRMSGYSFDIDPIYDGGGYLVRQWLADRELWNPIARVSSGDPSSMYGSITVRLVLVDDHLTALVNGVEVLTVESLKQASVDRGREAATGDRVGVQAWSSSDLVIDTLRVAQH